MEVTNNENITNHGKFEKSEVLSFRSNVCSPLIPRNKQRTTTMNSSITVRSGDVWGFSVPASAISPEAFGAGTVTSFPHAPQSAPRNISFVAERSNAAQLVGGIYTSKPMFPTSFTVIHHDRRKSK